MQFDDMKYAELNARMEKETVRRAMQVSRYEIPEIAGRGPEDFAVQGTVILSENRTEGIPWAADPAELAGICETYIRKKAVSRPVFKKRQEELIEQYAYVRSLRKALQQLQSVCAELTQLTSRQDSTSNSLLVNDHGRRTIFLKNKVAQRKYLLKELEKKEQLRAGKQKEYDHLARQCGQKEGQITDLENQIQTTYSGVIARLFHRREADAEEAANAILREKIGSFRSELDEMTEKRDSADRILRGILEDIANLSNQDERLQEEIERDEKALERIQKSFDLLKEREDRIAAQKDKIEELRKDPVLSSYTQEELIAMGTSMKDPDCLVSARKKLAEDAEAYLKAVSGIAEIQKQFMYLRDVLRGEALPDETSVRKAAAWLVYVMPALAMSEACRNDAGLSGLPVLHTEEGEQHSG